MCVEILEKYKIYVCIHFIFVLKMRGRESNAIKM